MILFDPNFDTLASGETPARSRVETPSQWEKAPIARLIETWIDAHGFWHMARTDEYKEVHVPQPVYSKYRDAKSREKDHAHVEESPEVESGEIEGSFNATRYADGVSERTISSSSFIWGGRWGR